MPIITLSPDVVTVGGSGWWAPVGTGSLVTAIADASDSTYLEYDFAGFGDPFVYVEFANTTIPADSYIGDVILSVRHGASAGQCTFRIYERAPDTPFVPAGYQLLTEGQLTAPSPTISNMILHRYLDPIGRPWQLANANQYGITMKGDDVSTPGLGIKLRIYLIEIQLNVNEIPVIAITAPTGTITTTNRPTITRSYSDAESDDQERRQIQILDSLGTVVYDSGIEFSASASAQIPRYLLEGSYTAQVRVGDVGSGTRLTAWATQAFTIDVANPAVPSIVATPQSVENRVRLDVTTSSGAISTTYVRIERSDDEGVSWHGIINGYEPGNMFLPGGYLTGAILYDYTAPRELPLQYRAVAVHNVDPIYSESAVSGIAIATLLSDGQDWLKSINNPSLNMPVKMAPEFSFAREEDLAPFRPLGRSDTVIMAGTIGVPRFNTLKFVPLTSLEYVTLAAIRDAQAVVLLQRACLGDNDSGLEQHFLRLGISGTTIRIPVRRPDRGQPSTFEIDAWTAKTPVTQGQ
jgi:hypothetical protein